MSVVAGAVNRRRAQLQGEGQRPGLVVAAREHRRVAQGRRRAAQRDAGGTGRGHDRRAGRAHRYPLLRVVDVRDGAVVGVAVVSGVPLVGARHRARGRERVAGGRGVAAVAVDRDRLRVHRVLPVVEREGDRAGRANSRRKAPPCPSSVTEVVPSVTLVALGVVVIAGLAGLTVTCSFASLMS